MSAGRHGRGLCSRRSKVLSRYCIQMPLTDNVEDGSDGAIWVELTRRLPAEVSERLVIGPTIGSPSRLCAPAGHSLSRAPRRPVGYED